MEEEEEEEDVDRRLRARGGERVQLGGGLRTQRLVAVEAVFRRWGRLGKKFRPEVVVVVDHLYAPFMCIRKGRVLHYWETPR